MASLLVPPGTINKLLTSVIFQSNPQLNITADLTTPAMVRFRTEGEASKAIPLTTSSLPSPQPYQTAVLTCSLVRSQGIAQIWESQRQTNSLIGSLLGYPDTTGLFAYLVTNCSIMNVEDQAWDGETGAYVVSIRGTYQINSALYV